MSEFHNPLLPSNSDIIYGLVFSSIFFQNLCTYLSIFAYYFEKIIGSAEDCDQSEEMMSSLMTTTSTGSNVTIIEQGLNDVPLFTFDF